jgi:hypothetical protein
VFFALLFAIIETALVFFPARARFAVSLCVYILNSRMRSAEFVNAVRRARHRADRVPLPISRLKIWRSTSVIQARPLLG